MSMYSPYPTHYAPGKGEVLRSWCGLVVGWHTHHKSTSDRNLVTCGRCWKSIRKYDRTETAEPKNVTPEVV